MLEGTALFEGVGGAEPQDVVNEGAIPRLFVKAKDEYDIATAANFLFNLAANPVPLTYREVGVIVPAWFVPRLRSLVG